MARINSIDYSRFGNENYLSFSRKTCTIIEAFAIVGQRFGYLTAPYAAAVEELDEAMKQPTWSDLTKPIADKDEARDRVLISFKALVESMRHYSPIEGVTGDAERVYRFIKLNHVNPAAQYDKETAQISNLLQDLERYCQAEVQRMAVGPMLTELGRLNDEVAALIAQRDIEDSVKKNEAVKTARRKCDQLYVALKDSVNGAALVDADGLLTAFIDAVNQMIKRQETQVLKVPTTGAGAEGEGTPGDGGSNGDNTDTPSDGDNTDQPGGGNTGGGSELTPDDEQTGGNGGNENTNPGGGNGSTGGSSGGGNTGVGDPITPGPGGDDDDL